MATWTDEMKEEIVAAYQKREPTPENTLDIIQELAEQYEQSPNGVRMVLSKAGVYVKKAAASKASSDGDEEKPKRISKEEAHNGLREAINAIGQPVNDEVISKLTGKAATYFAEVIRHTAT